MDEILKLELRMSAARQELADLLEKEPESEKVGTLTQEMRAIDRQILAHKIAKPEPETRVVEGDAEGRELMEVRSRIDMGDYVKGAISRAGVRDGAASEYNTHLGLEGNKFPLDLLVEHRAKRDGDAEGNQGTWVDRVFRDTAAMQVGISFMPVPPGVYAIPVTTAGGTPVQRGREEDTSESTYTVDVTEMKPARRSVHGIYSVEDDARLPGLADAIIRDMRAAMVESVDLAVFNGDAGANENVADIVGMQTAGIVETTVTQTNKIKGDELLKVFLAYVDGQYASSLGDVRIVASVGSNTLWGGSLQAATVDTKTIASFLRENGVNWTVKGGVDTNTANGDFGAYVGLARGNEGAGLAAVWMAGELLVTDPYSGAKSGEVQLSLHYLWNLAFPRTANFKRIKYVS